MEWESTTLLARTRRSCCGTRHGVSVHYITTRHKASLLWYKTWNKCTLHYYHAQGVPVVEKYMESVPTTLLPRTRRSCCKTRHGASVHYITTTQKAFLLWNKTWSDCILHYYHAQGVPVVKQDMERVYTTLLPGRRRSCCGTRHRVSVHYIITTHKVFLLWSKTWSECTLNYYHAQGVPVEEQDMEWVPTTLLPRTRCSCCETRHGVSVRYIITMHKAFLL
jgi:hypothetical protein